jgi:hypothetical protein
VLVPPVAAEGGAGMIRKRLVRRIDPVLGGYDPRLTITVEGITDVYRLARHLELGQSEFAALGRRILRSMDDQAPGSVRYLTTRMGPARLLSGARGGRRRRPRQLKLELGMPAEVVQELEEAVR